MKRICLLGASGSIGGQTLDVIRKHPVDFSLVGFSVGKQVDKIPEIINEFNPKFVCVKEDTKDITKQFHNVKFFYGDEGLNKLIKACDCDMVVNALVGFVGLKPSLTALENDKILSLANKETLVTGGELINKLLREGKGKLIPIDSEHVALSKCLAVDNTNVDKIVITASGGAFRKLSRDQLENVTPEDALKHPTWSMGQKITIDSATMVNKTFEIIEAYYLFGYKYEDIELMFNYESFVHSLVRYKNGSYRLDEGKPDMRVPIKYALYEGSCEYDLVYVDKLEDYKASNLYPFEYDRFPIVNLAKKVIDEKGLYGATFNAANEEAVYAFLNKKIKFTDIENIIDYCVNNVNNIQNPSYEDIRKCDLSTRELVAKIVKGEIK
ncbi:MAG: 1-deoxy-D-xylulose-5-phosphate reductoisomerase [Bacilli bacterium]|nr:1-deoxy-D-xylulose-5-phosphate reductoisomerase [Bacilli bacterium]